MRCGVWWVLAVTRGGVLAGAGDVPGHAPRRRREVDQRRCTLPPSFVRCLACCRTLLGVGRWSPPSYMPLPAFFRPGVLRALGDTARVRRDRWLVGGDWCWQFRARQAGTQAYSAGAHACMWACWCPACRQWLPRGARVHEGMQASHGGQQQHPRDGMHAGSDGGGWHTHTRA